MLKVGSMLEFPRGSVVFGLDDPLSGKKRPQIIVGNSGSTCVEYGEKITTTGATTKRGNIFCIPVCLTDHYHSAYRPNSYPQTISFINPLSVCHFSVSDFGSKRKFKMVDSRVMDLYEEFWNAYIGDSNKYVKRTQKYLNNLADYWHSFCTDNNIPISVAQVPQYKVFREFKLFGKIITGHGTSIPGIPYGVQIPEIFFGEVVDNVDSIKESFNSTEIGEDESTYYDNDDSEEDEECPEIKLDQSTEHLAELVESAVIKATEPVVEESKEESPCKLGKHEKRKLVRLNNNKPTNVLTPPPAPVMPRQIVKPIIKTPVDSSDESASPRRERYIPEKEYKTVYSDSIPREAMHSDYLPPIPPVSHGGKPGRRPGEQNPVTWSLHDCIQFVRETEKVIRLKMEPNKAFEYWGHFNYGNFKRTFNTCVERIHNEKPSYILPIEQIPRGKDPFSAKNKGIFVK